MRRRSRRSTRSLLSASNGRSTAKQRWSSLLGPFREHSRSVFDLLLGRRNAMRLLLMTQFGVVGFHVNVDKDGRQPFADPVFQLFGKIVGLQKRAAVLDL